MLTPPEALRAASVVSIAGIGGACRAVREMRGEPKGTDVSQDITDAVGLPLYLLAEHKVERLLREFAKR